MAFFFLGERKRPKGSCWRLYGGGGEEGNLNGLNYQKNTAFKIKKKKAFDINSVIGMILKHSSLNFLFKNHI